MIYFFCSECKEELEAEDSIRGVKMKCPACAKEIEVPQASVKVTTRTGAVKKAEHEHVSHAAPSVLPQSRFILVVLVAGTAGLLALTGIGYYLNERARQVRLNLPKCDICSGKKTVPCARCRGNKTEPCLECKGSGVRKNVRDQEERCLQCNAGRRDCPVCGARGEYGCAACAGTGLRDVPPEMR